MNKLFPAFLAGRSAVGLLFFRLVVGVALIMHGTPKIMNPMGWMGDAVPGFLQLLAAVAEFGGGIALVLGLLTPVAAFFVGCVMLGAMFLVHFPGGDPFVARGGGASYELALVYFASAVLLLTVGPGTLSADYRLFRRSAPTLNPEREKQPVMR